MPAQALLLDFNGTISDDEDVLYDVYAAMAAEHGRTLTRAVYFSALAGRSDEEILTAVLGDGCDVGAATAERVRRYSALAADGRTVSDAARAAIALAASHVPVAVVSSAWRSEVEPVLRSAAIERFISSLVCAEDTSSRKPSPEPYLLACRLLGVRSPDAVAIEDTVAGVTAAKRAGVYCAALTTTMSARELAAADVLLDAFDRDAVELLLEL